MLAPGDLVFCAGTAAAAPLQQRVPAAAAAGYRGLSIFPTDYARARADGLSNADLRALFRDNEVEVADIDPLLTWVPGGVLPPNATVEGENFFSFDEDDFYRMHDAVRARSINAALMLMEAPEPQRVVDAFGELCERAARHDLIVHLEFMPFGVVPDLPRAVEIVRAVDQPNAGIQLDTWHHFRSGGDSESLRAAPIEWIQSVQLSDAPSEAEDNIVDETLHRRRMPGEGDAPIAEWLAILREGRAPAPFGVEVFDDPLQARPVGEIAERTADAVRALLPS